MNVCIDGHGSVPVQGEHERDVPVRTYVCKRESVCLHVCMNVCIDGHGSAPVQREPGQNQPVSMYAYKCKRKCICTFICM